MHSLSNGNPLYVELAMKVLQVGSNCHVSMSVCSTARVLSSIVLLPQNETPFFRKTPDGLGVALDVALECTVRVDEPQVLVLPLCLLIITSRVILVGTGGKHPTPKPDRREHRSFH